MTIGKRGFQPKSKTCSKTPKRANGTPVCPSLKSLGRTWRKMTSAEKSQFQTWQSFVAKKRAQIQNETKYFLDCLNSKRRHLGIDILITEDFMKDITISDMIEMIGADPREYEEIIPFGLI